MFFVAFIMLIVVGYVGQFYHFRNFTRDGEIAEAVIYNERFGTRGVPFYDYKYSIGRENYSGKAYYYYGGLKCGDTIMVIIKTKIIQESMAVRLDKDRCALLAFNSYRMVVVNNMSLEERRSLEDRIMADLRKRYRVKDE